jgi:hypothetical protein
MGPQDILPDAGSGRNQRAILIREQFADYFISREGELKWQCSKIQTELIWTKCFVKYTQ